jgi:hypothetical protein
VALSHAWRGTGRPDFSGDGGRTTSAQLKGATGLAIDVSGNLFITDSGNDRVHESMTVDGAEHRLAGAKPEKASRVVAPAVEFVKSHTA